MEAQEGIEDAIKDKRTRRLALLIAALAALLAVVEMRDDNTAQDAVKSNIDASDLWSFFQAKTLRQFILERDSETLALERDGATPERQAAIDAQLKSWRAKMDQYDSDPATNEGKKELTGPCQAGRGRPRRCARRQQSVRLCLRRAAAGHRAGFRLDHLGRRLARLGRRGARRRVADICYARLLRAHALAILTCE
jgi:hypothetical protein